MRRSYHSEAIIGGYPKEEKIMTCRFCNSPVERESLTIGDYILCKDCSKMAERIAEKGVTKSFIKMLLCRLGALNRLETLHAEELAQGINQSFNTITFH